MRKGEAHSAAPRNDPRADPPGACPKGTLDQAVLVTAAGGRGEPFGGTGSNGRKMRSGPPHPRAPPPGPGHILRSVAAARALLRRTRASSIRKARITFFTSGSAGQATESAVMSRPRRRKAPRGFAAISPHTLTSMPGGPGHPGHLVDLAHHRGMERVVEVRQPRVGAVHGQRVLDQVVRPDREEVAVPRELRGVERRGGGLDEDPQLVAGGKGIPSRRKAISSSRGAPAPGPPPPRRSPGEA
jgi:hypothetical protein